MTGFLALEDGTVFRGESVAAEGFAFGEAVFTTAMTGYQEIATDPSFAEQLVCFTAPMVGNYGVAAGRSESGRVHARAVLMREARGPAWTDWLHERGVVALSGIDTRSLVLRLREGGAMRAAASPARAPSSEALAAVRTQPSMEGRALAAGVSTREPYVYSDVGRDACRGRRLRLQALDPAAARGRGRRRDGLPARRRAPTSSPATTASSSPTARATRRRSPTRPRPWPSSPAAFRSSASASATSCSRAPPAATP